MRIIGISPLHDSSVAVINDGELEYFFKEERLSRSKRDGPPVLAIQKLIETVKDPVDHICIAAPTGDDPCVKYIVTQLKKIFKVMNELCRLFIQIIFQGLQTIITL